MNDATAMLADLRAAKRAEGERALNDAYAQVWRACADIKALAPDIVVPHVSGEWTINGVVITHADRVAALEACRARANDRLFTALGRYARLQKAEQE